MMNLNVYVGIHDYMWEQWLDLFVCVSGAVASFAGRGSTPERCSMEHDERRGTQGQHKPFQIALRLNNAAVCRREGRREAGVVEVEEGEELDRGVHER